MSDGNFTIMELLYALLRLALGLAAGAGAHLALLVALRRGMGDLPHAGMLLEKFQRPMLVSWLLAGAWLATAGLDVAGLRLSIVRIGIVWAGWLWIQGALAALDVLRASDQR